MSFMPDAQHPLYGTWKMMHFRCSNPKAGGYRFYGGRGIRVCDRWQSFEAFVSDVGAKPTKNHVLDRIDVNDHYHPYNCRWITRSENNLARNKRPPLDLVPLALAVLEAVPKGMVYRGFKQERRGKRKKSR
jgi:hypothetical protein